MAGTIFKHSGALAATVGTLVAVGLLVLTTLAVGVRPAEAVDGGGEFNLTDNTTNDFSPSYSPSGEKIAYRGVATNDIYIINVDGMGKVNLTNDARQERDPSWSPDGQKIVYSRWDGQDWEIYTIDATGGTPSQLTNNTTDELELSWSPNGEKIAYEGYDGQGRDKEIYTINVDGTGEFNVTNNNTYDTDPSWSPDGQKLAYSGRDPEGTDPEIYTIDATGGTPSQLTNNTTADTELCWSPDGRRIAYKGRDIAPRDNEIYTITIGSARKVSQVTHNLRNDGEPSYSPDGEKIAYEGEDGQDKEIFLRMIDKTPPRVTRTTPANKATRIAPGANVVARFSEAMQGSSVTTATFKLRKAGTTRFLGATITYDPATKRATLNPNNLRSGATYVATVTRSAKDLAGNSLDQNSNTAGNQNKTWKFKVR